MSLAKDYKKRVFVYSTISECPFRKLDAIKVRNFFVINNFETANTPETADYIIYFTCSVTTAIIKSQLEALKGIQKFKGELIIMGCMPATNAEDLRTVFSGKAVVTKNIHDIDQYFQNFRIKYHQIPEVYICELDETNILTDLDMNLSLIKLFRKYGFSHTYYRQFLRKRAYKNFSRINFSFNIKEACFLVICTGCVNNCSYCNIREAIGWVKSKSINELITEYKDLLDKDYRLFHIASEDLCSYGIDIDSTLLKLLQALSEVDSSYSVKWSLHGINPKWLVKNYNELIPLIKSKKIWEITVAIENGSDKILKLMNRHYKIREVKSTLILLRKINPGLKINTLLILGFPTETEEDINETLNLIKKVKFDGVTVSGYSEFEKRPSAKILPKVSQDVINERTLRARELLHKLKTPFVR